MDGPFPSPEPNNEVEALQHDALRRLMRGEQREAEEVLSRALTAAQAMPDGDEMVAGSLELLGSACEAGGDPERAEAHYRRSLEIYERHESPRRMGILLTLGKLLMDSGRLREAEPLFERALALGEELAGPESLPLMKAQRHLSRLYAQQGREGDAERLLRSSQASLGGYMAPIFQAEAEAMSSFDLNSPELSPEGLAELEPLIRRSLHLTEQMVGPEHAGLLPLLDQLAAILRRTDRAAEADAVDSRAERIRAQQ